MLTNKGGEMLRKSALAFLVVAAFAGAGWGQDHPNLAGTWKLNLSKSNPGDFGPSARTEVITQDGSKFTDKVDSTTNMGDESYTLNFTADGTKVTVPPDSPQASLGGLTLKDITASWSGDSLVLVEDVTVQNQFDLALKLTYSLSADGKTLNVKNTATTPMGDSDSSLVFDKQ